MKRLVAALSFFTRLPVWRIATVPAEYYKRVVPLWPVAGLLTGGIAAAVFYGLAFLLPPLAAAAGAYVARLLVTGALHEDGLADFFDGMGGGTSRERILEIMKDSHIGTYGVIGLLMWMMVVIPCVASFNALSGAALIFSADVWSKACGAQIINFLPYARKETEAKNRTVYSRMTVGELLLCLAVGVAPVMLLPWPVTLAALAPVAVTSLLLWMMHRKIQGYTGDCCGALFLLNELAYILAATATMRLVG